MIIDALIATMNPIIDTYTSIGDIASSIPFAVIAVEPSPIKTKDGIVGYTQKVSVAIIDKDIDRIELKTIAIVSALKSMSGTISDCVINSVDLDSENGIEFDVESQTYQNALEFTFDTDTR